MTLIARDNEELLKSLGLSTPGRPPRPALTKTPSNASVKKRSKPSTPRSLVTPSKVRRTDDTPTPSSGLRRSARSSARKSYAEDGENAKVGRGRRDGDPGSAKRGSALGVDDFVADSDEEEKGERVKQRNNKALGVRLHDPCVPFFMTLPLSDLGLTASKQYGAIPDVEVGRWWATR